MDKLQKGQPQTGSPQPTLAKSDPSTTRHEPFMGFGGAPFSLMRRFMSEMDSLFDDVGLGSSMQPRHLARGTAGWWSPQIDVTTRDNHLFVHADLPGLKQEDVKVTVTEGLLSIAGERADRHEEHRAGVQRRERRYGSFLRQIPLPEGVNPDDIKASFENGVLEVSMPLPKRAEPKGREIPIQPKPSTGPDVH